MNFLKYFPKKYKPRDTQHNLLVDGLKKAWEDGYKNIVILAPVAFGKSVIGKTISEASKASHLTTALCVPTVILQEQYQNEFEDLPVLKGRDRYSCKELQISCGDHKRATNTYCSGCPYIADKQAVTDNYVGVFNLYSYMYLRDKKDIVILDEAQVGIGQFRDMFTYRFWQHIDHYPDDINTHGDLAIFMESKIAHLKECAGEETDKLTQANYLKLEEKLSRILRSLKIYPGSFFYEHKQGYYRGSLRNYLEVRPFIMKGMIPKIQNPKKLVLMSATLGKYDLIELGIDPDKTKFIEAESEIPVENRPIRFFPSYRANYANIGNYEHILADNINTLMKRHKGKGLVHVTYALMDELKKHLDNDRIMWHTKKNKIDVFKEFVKSEDKVLIAAGLSEGIDLKGKEFEWQVLSKMVYPSTADGLIARQKAHDKDWYIWQTVKTVLQQYGRICRSPDDYGITYILDSSFRGLFYGDSRKFFPWYFKQAVKRVNSL